MSRKPFAALTELGQARRLRPLGEAALEQYDLGWTGLRLIGNRWNCVLRVDTPDGPSVIRITRPVPGAAERSVRSEVEFMDALAAGTDVAVPTVRHNRDGELVTLASADGVPGPRACVVFAWLGGPDLAVGRSPAQNPSCASANGRPAWPSAWTHPWGCSGVAAGRAATW